MNWARYRGTLVVTVTFTALFPSPVRELTTVEFAAVLLSPLTVAMLPTAELVLEVEPVAL
jgi:hypothetical protein